MQSAVLRASAIGLGRVARPVIRHLCVRPHGETRSTPFVTVSRVRTLVSRSATRGTAGRALLIYAAGANGCRLSHVASHRSVRGRRRARRVWTIRRLVATPASDPRRRALQRAAPRGRRSRTSTSRRLATCARAGDRITGRAPPTQTPASRTEEPMDRARASPDGVALSHAASGTGSPRAVRPLREPRSTIARSLGCGLFGRASRARSGRGAHVDGVRYARAGPTATARESRPRAWRERMSEPDCDDNVLPAAALTV